MSNPNYLTKFSCTKEQTEWIHSFSPTCFDIPGVQSSANAYANTGFTHWTNS